MLYPDYPDCTERADIHRRLEDFLVYQKFMMGLISQYDFQSWLLRQTDVSEDYDRKAFYLRLYHDQTAMAIANAALGTPEHQQPDSDWLGFEDFSHEFQRSNFRTDYKTFIYPEEAWLLYSLVATTKRRHTLVIGSYFGFWAMFAAAAARHHDGAVSLIDPDFAACSEASRLLGLMGLHNVRELIAHDALQCRIPLDFDLLVLDAETPKDHPDPRLQGKAIYAPLLERYLPRMPEGRRLVVAHNILFEAPGQPWMEKRIAYNLENMREFRKMTERAEYALEVPTTEGVGLYRF